MPIIDFNPITLELPLPPSVNHYWFRSKTGMLFLTTKANHFIRSVKNIVDNFDVIDAFPIVGKVIRCEYEYYPPNNIHRDGHNFDKALFDALEKAGVVQDDTYIREWHGKMHTNIVPPDGLCVIRIGVVETFNEKELEKYEEKIGKRRLRAIKSAERKAAKKRDKGQDDGRVRPVDAGDG